MVTMTLFELVSIKKSLDNIFLEKMNPNLAFRFLKLLKKIQNEYDNISETQKKFSSDYQGEDLNQKFNEFLITSKIDISQFPKISMNDIIDSNIKISPVDLNSISNFIIEE
jgi:hypothetical protein